jgi:hypothetical protein
MAKSGVTTRLERREQCQIKQGSIFDNPQHVVGFGLRAVLDGLATQRGRVCRSARTIYCYMSLGLFMANSPHSALKSARS